MSATAMPDRPAAGWADRWHAITDRLLADEKFRRWAAAFPLTRPIARRRARGLFDLCAGFVYSQILLSCVELRLFEILAERPLPLSLLAPLIGLTEPQAARLLAGAVALRLIARRGEKFGLGPLGGALVGNAGLVAMIEHHRMLYADLRDPVALLRGQAGPTALAAYWPYAGAGQPAALDSEDLSPYTKLMAASQPMVAGEILDVVSFRRHRCLLDLGGGDGSFLIRAAARAPKLNLMLFDLPAIADRARANFAAAGLSDRARSFGGDFRSDSLPAGADVVSLIRVLHDHDDDQALTILRAARRALPPGGTLLLAEPMAETPGAEPVGDAYFGFYLLAMGTGRARNPAAFAILLNQTGFASPRHLRTRTPLLTSVLVATAIEPPH